MRRWSIGAIISVLVILGSLLAFTFWQYLGFRTSLETLPAGVTVAGLDVSGMTVDQALSALQAAFAQPVQLDYQEQALALTPESVAFQFDLPATQTAIESALAGRNSLEGFLTYLLRRPTEPVAIQVVADYSPDRLDGFLSRVSQQYDHPPIPPVPLPAALTFRAGQAGYELDFEASRQAVVAALFSATSRYARLVVTREEAPGLEAEQLEAMFDSLLGSFDGIASIFVKDMQTGTEITINPEVAYAGMSVIKIAIMVEAYRALSETPSIDETRLLSETMTLSGNFTANLLLQEVIGRGDAYQGVENLTASMQYLGLINTFMAAPYDEEIIPPTIITPANSRTDLNTQPDPYMQTTAQDIGLLLEMIYQCQHGGGALLAAYPDAFTPQECQQMLDMMVQNEIDTLIESGLPPDTPVAHKHGWIGDTHSDAGLVFSPDGDFVLVIFLYHPDWLEWEISSALIADLSAATYNYFNPAE
ncbi:MAG: serine hydrolase [Anaerolineae bacterium]|nr:serine hydrolase [Anaerolineae bacterium]